MGPAVSVDAVESVEERVGAQPAGHVSLPLKTVRDFSRGRDALPDWQGSQGCQWVVALIGGRGAQQGGREGWFGLGDLCRYY